MKHNTSKTKLGLFEETIWSYSISTWRAQEYSEETQYQITITHLLKITVETLAYTPNQFLL